jgi:hypothetical protein
MLTRDGRGARLELFAEDAVAEAEARFHELV